jgi:hypothetical protein
LSDQVLKQNSKFKKTEFFRNFIIFSKSDAIAHFFLKMVGEFSNELITNNKEETPSFNGVV